MNQKILNNPYDWANDVSKETKELFELDDILYNLSIKLFDYRNNRQMSQKELAAVLEISQAMVSKLESGEYNPSVAQLWKISKKLDLDFKIIFQEKTTSASAERFSSTIDYWSQNKNSKKSNLTSFNRKIGASA